MNAELIDIKATRRVEQSKLEFVSSGDFVRDFEPPNYLIDQVMQRRFIYSLTAPTGGGKTAIALRVAANIALGESLAGKDVEQGHVLYLAGENPDDLRMRWIAQADVMGFDPEKISVTFLPSIIEISKSFKEVKKFSSSVGGLAFVIVDTSAAYFGGDNENDNTQMAEHARNLRSFTTIEGRPAVLLLCHPTKNAKKGSALQPRGGGSFLAEIDGNIVGKKANDRHIVTLSPHDKFRGVPFDPLVFKLESKTTEGLKDSKGQLIPTVVASPLNGQDWETVKSGGKTAPQDVLLSAMQQNSGRSFQEYADEIGKTKRQVQSMMEKLKNQGIVEKGTNNRYQLT